MTRRIGLNRRRRLERGVVMIEAAIGLLVLSILAFGVIDYGRLISHHLALTSAVAAATRAGTAAGVAETADYDILQAVRNSEGFMSLDDIETVVIYKSATPSGVPTPQCADARAVAGWCNVYHGSDVLLSPSALSATNRDKSWPSTERQSGSDFLGVKVVSKHFRLTSMFGDREMLLADSAVMQVDPDITKPWLPPPIPTTAPKPPPSAAPKPVTTKPAKPVTTTTTRGPGVTTTTTTAKPVPPKPRTTTTTAKPKPRPTTTTTFPNY